MHLVGFILRICHDARSPERQISLRACPSDSLRFSSFRIAERSVIEFLFDTGEVFGNLTTFVLTTRKSSTPEDRTEAQSVDLAVAWVLYNIKYNSASIIGLLSLQSPRLSTGISAS